MKKPLAPTLGIAAVALAGLLAVTAYAAKTQSAVVPIDNGANKVTLDGADLIVLRAYRENYNAHSFDTVSFYSGSLVDKKQQLGVVPIFSAQRKEPELHEITIGGGADCNLTDFRLVKGGGGRPARLIVAHRDPGSSYADEATVRFVVYEFTKSEEGDAGTPPLSFQEKSRSNSKKKFCDVNEAFDQELHLGTASGSQH